jgi:hypothetical protein
VRGDIGENLAFAFVPLILYFIYKLSVTPKLRYSLLGALSLAFLILAHNAIALITVPFIVIYSAYLIWVSKFNKYLILYTSFLILFGFALSAFFWVPALLEGKFTLRNIVTKGTYINSFVNFKALVYGPWNYGGSGVFTQQLGVIQWLALLLSPILAVIFWLRKDKKYLLVLASLLFTLVAIFLMLPVSNFVWAKVMLLQNFQFPWRFLAITVYSTAILAALMIYALPKKLQLLTVLILIAAVLFISKDYLEAKGYLYKPAGFYTGIYRSTTDTGESSPIWSVRFMEHTPKAHLEMLDGQAAIKETGRTSTSHAYTVNVKKKTLFAENTLYFPGWSILANGIPVDIQFQDPHYKGIMTFRLDPGTYKIQAIYRETKLRLICDLISLTSLVMLVSLLGLRFVKGKFS